MTLTINNDVIKAIDLSSDTVVILNHHTFQVTSSNHKKKKKSFDQKKIIKSKMGYSMQINNQKLS